MGPKQKRHQKKHRQKGHIPKDAPNYAACTNNGSPKDLKKRPESQGLLPAGGKEEPAKEARVLESGVATTKISQTFLKPKSLCETIREWTEAVFVLKMFALALATLLLFILEVYILIGAGLSRHNSPNPNDTDRLYPREQRRSPTAPQVRFQTINSGPIAGSNRPEKRPSGPGNGD